MNQRATLTLESGRGEFIVPLALDDPHGDWTLTAVDVATGVQAKTVWRD